MDGPTYARKVRSRALRMMRDRGWDKIWAVYGHDARYPSRFVLKTSLRDSNAKAELIFVHAPQLEQRGLDLQCFEKLLEDVDAVKAEAGVRLRVVVAGYVCEAAGAVGADGREIAPVGPGAPPLPGLYGCQTLAQPARGGSRRDERLTTLGISRQPWSRRLSPDLWELNATDQRYVLRAEGGDASAETEEEEPLGLELLPADFFAAVEPPGPNDAFIAADNKEVLSYMGGGIDHVCQLAHIEPDDPVAVWLGAVEGDVIVFAPDVLCPGFTARMVRAKPPAKVLPS